jgi:hypothetical protein
LEPFKTPLNQRQQHQPSPMNNKPGSIDHLRIPEALPPLFQKVLTPQFRSIAPLDLCEYLRLIGSS